MVKGMKENTRITTIQITEVERISDKMTDYIVSDEAKAIYKNNMELSLKKMLGVDDVKVTNVQDFIQDVEE